mmetsp:Transcript_46608/g.105329  ORF Transcript_46608/g.105329 Transcript_46608/m.105329 type:complete len:223 (-) Transcript_46608:29-697(-)
MAFQELRVALRVSLLPASLGGPLAAIEGNLHAQLMRYDRALGGVVLSYSDIKILDEGTFVSGQINIDEPHIHVRATATAHLFAPRKGMTLPGRVTEVAATHVSVLCYGVFNATIPLKGAPDVTAGIGDSIMIRVLQMQHGDGLLHLEGSLVDETHQRSGDQAGGQPLTAGKKRKSTSAGGGDRETKTPKKKDAMPGGGSAKSDRKKEKKEKKKEKKKDKKPV